MLLLFSVMTTSLRPPAQKKYNRMLLLGILQYKRGASTANENKETQNLNSNAPQKNYP